MTDERRVDGSIDLVATLMQAGGRRIEPPEEAYRAVLEAAQVALRAKVTRRRWWRAGAWLAAAAAAGAFAVGLGPSLWSPAMPPVEVARVDRVAGSVEWRAAGARDWTRLEAAAGSLHLGGTVRTRPGAGIGLVYPDRSSLRLGPGTEIELTDTWSVTLRTGTLYAATAGSETPGRVEVVTPRGRVRHLGTQFELRFEAPVLRVRVREGRVALSGAAGRVVAQAGEELSIGTSGGAERRSFAADDPAWRWTESLGPIPQLGDGSAQALLEWAARETGRVLEYANPAVEQRAATVVLHGDPGPLEPAAALEVMLATTDLGVDLAERGRIRVFAK